MLAVILVSELSCCCFYSSQLLLISFANKPSPNRQFIHFPQAYTSPPPHHPPLPLPFWPLWLYTHTYTHTLSLSYTHIHSLSLTHTHKLSLSPSHTHTHTLSLIHSLSLPLPHTHTHTHSLSHTHTYTLSLTHTHTLPLSLTHTHTHAHTHKGTRFTDPEDVWWCCLRRSERPWSGRSAAVWWTPPCVPRWSPSCTRWTPLKQHQQCQQPGSMFCWKLMNPLFTAHQVFCLKSKQGEWEEPPFCTRICYHYATSVSSFKRTLDTLLLVRPDWPICILCTGFATLRRAYIYFQTFFL